MLTFKGQVLQVTDETRQLPEKDKQGVSTGRMKDVRFVKIQILCDAADGKSKFAANVTAMNPTNLVVPKVGATWETPEVRKYDASTGFPEISL